MNENDPVEQFRRYVAGNIEGAGSDSGFRGLSEVWVRESIRHNYAQNFTWLGRPIIQVPQDTYAIQELIWACRPDLVIETGIAHGGSLVMSASMLAMLDYCDAVEAGSTLDPAASRRKVVGVDIDIRAHNRSALDAHPMRHKLHLLEGSSIDPAVADQIFAHAEGYDRIMVFLDSNHTHDHVLEELKLYAPLTSRGSYCVVWDTGVEDLPADMCGDRPWGKGDNPKTAVWAYLAMLETDGATGRDGAPLRFATDKTIETKLMITASPDGFLKRV
ncbi:cephalosporin hydroxylase family protein [Aurantimonas sp. 22II-16-19i]|uniref:cephalosporin hydroxylase family protein n=1 Tax=Aurantimonas sp. 22II-16-19i TaxID=1317114 RepID=UPI0009F7F7EB|nr:cephalosporin hydroxylase family protein [Aurantimonas sp. 22II-16-19i]ORE89947.1 cephalosporin protein [Aurantimonas sp. 22II-16-19i]